MSDREFFVGYLPVPAGQKRFLLFLLPVVLVAMLAFAYSIASAQLSAGEGRWDPYTSDNIQGYLAIDPYPVLHRADGSSVLLVRAGKLSAEEYVSPYNGQHVAIRGAPIERGGWYMREIVAPEDIQVVAPSTDFDPPPSRLSETVQLSGEIIDSKCFLGVMKPGAGKVHRACAAMCLTGGMPPMLVVTDTAGDKFGYMLVMPDGTSASKHLVPDVAVPVTINGRLEIRGDLTYLIMAENGVARISSNAAEG